MNKHIESIDNFALTIYKLLKSDRDVVLGVGGMTGEGKSTFLTKLQKKYAEISETYWGFDRMTWCRKELMNWIDGKGKEKKGRLPQYSSILADELFTMFYRRKWFESDQIDAIATFNMCRDRHLFVGGNIPDLWDLDTAFVNRLRFYAYIPKRGVAWIFQPENNPFSNDKWNVTQNKKNFRNKKNPYNLPNFVCEIRFDDWDEEEKKEYYKIRNTKRVEALNSNKETEKKERYKDIKKQRDEIIRLLFNTNPKLTLKDVSDVVGLSQEAVRLIKFKEL